MSSIYEIRRISDLGRYIDFLLRHQNDILVCAAASDTLFNIDEKSKKKLQSIGMTELGVGGWIGYVYINDQGDVKIDKRSEKDKSIFARGNVSNLKVELASKSFRDGCEAKIFINGIDFAVNWRGINIVVFDMKNMKLVDSVCFDFFPNTTTKFRRYFCSYCSLMEQENQKKREKQVKKVLPLVHIGEKWATIQEVDSQNLAMIIQKFDEGYHTVSIVDSEGNFQRLVDKNQFREDFPKKEYRTQKDLHVEYESDEDEMKFKLANLFFATPRCEIPILQDGKIKAVGRYSSYFDSEGRWDSRQVYNIHWEWIDDSVAKEYFANRKKILISSEKWFLKGFREKFSSCLDIEVYRDDFLDKCIAGEFDILIAGSNVFQKLPIEQRQAHQLYCTLLSETVRRWLDKHGVELHYMSTEDKLPGIENMLSNQKKLIGGTVGYLRECEEPYFIVDGNDLDKVVGTANVLPNFHAGRRCVTEANSLQGNSIFFYGPCTAVGYASYDPDENIESFLQKLINEENLNYHVVNCGTEGVVGEATTINWLYRMMDTPVRRGDKMIVFLTPSLFWGKDLGVFPVKIHKLVEAFTDNSHFGKKYFVDAAIGHMNVAGYEVAANYIFKELQNDIREENLSFDSSSHTFFRENSSSINGNSKIARCLEHLPDLINIEDKGAIILQTDSLTMQQGYLIQEAVKRCKYLYIFLIGSDEEAISTKKTIIEEYTKEFSVTIYSLGMYMRDCYMWDWKLVQFKSVPPRKFDPIADTYTFARYIAPHLGIKKYFSLADGGDTFEHRYNILKQEILREEGMEWIEISRI